MSTRDKVIIAIVVSLPVAAAAIAFVHPAPHLTTKYLLQSVIVGGCSVAFTLRAIKTAKDRRDSNRIYVFLCRNFENGQYRFQTSEAISVVTNLSVSRVAKLCGKHPRIEKKEYERHAWRVGNSADETAEKERNQTQ